MGFVLAESTQGTTSTRAIVFDEGWAAGGLGGDPPDANLSRAGLGGTRSRGNLERRSGGL